MKNSRFIIALLLPLFIMSGCYSDSAGNPSFGDRDVPRILGQWAENQFLSAGDILELDFAVSPSDGATYKWILDGDIVSTERVFKRQFDELGEFNLIFEVERNGVFNSRTATVLVGSEFVPKEYNKIALGFLTINGGVTSDVYWDNITHLVISSSVVTENLPSIAQGGQLPAILSTNLTALINLAHSKGVFVIMEYSGVINHLNAATAWESYTFLNPAIDPAYRTALINAMVNFAVDNNFDGINVYMDKSHGGPSFAPDQVDGLKAFFNEFTAAVPAETERGKFLLTMSLYIGWTNAALSPFVGNERFDWFNILAFAAEDLTPGPHSSMWLMQDHVNQWINWYSVPAAKLIPVAPAFALRYFGNVDDYTWGNLGENTEYIPYRTLITRFPSIDVPNNNFINVDNGIWYDGLADVKAKAEFAVSQDLAGMGLWSLEGDSLDPSKSLMKQINTSLGN